MALPIRSVLLVYLLAHSAAAKEPIQIPSEADAKKAYYDCLFGYIYDKTDWDVTSNELLDIAVTRCEDQSVNVLLAILKERESLKLLGSEAGKMATGIRDAFLERARKDAAAFIFEERNRPEAK